MKYIIVGNVDSTLIIAMDMSICGSGSTCISEEPLEPEELTHSISKGVILNFIIGMSNNRLFRVAPINEGSAKQEPIVNG